MKTTSFVSAALTAFVLSTGVALADDPALYAGDAFVQTVTSQLEAQGFAVVDVERTLLGRYKIEAVSADGMQRELVISANTGEVLRDQVDQVSVEGYEDDSDENELENDHDNSDDDEIDGDDEDDANDMDNEVDHESDDESDDA